MAWSALVPLVSIALAVTLWSGSVRWRLASTLPLQCDEIPLLVRFTGLNGRAVDEAQARGFVPSLYTLRTGALRSLRVPPYTSTLHTTTGFWTNLGLHLFGDSPAAGRVMTLCWSAVGLVGVAWAAWLVTGGIGAACLAVSLMALSPFHVAYSAQARGYAEAVALTPFLLIALEYLRRRPACGFRPVVVLLLAFQLSLTVYTMWVYWVVPAMLLAFLLLPASIPDGTARRQFRTSLTLVCAGLAAAMGIYTVDRWVHLVQTGGHFGVELASLEQVARFMARLFEQLLPGPPWVSAALLAAAAGGVAVLWRSQVRWWLAVFAAGVVVPAALAVVNGSPGFVRTLAYLLVPAAILAGAGLEILVRKVVAAGASRRFRIAMGIAGAGLAVGITVPAASGLERRARDILLPDWGEVTLALSRETATHGPRWFCPCLANHWQINWYRSNLNDESILQVEPGETIEVILGAQFDDHGEPVVFRHDPVRDWFVQERIPAYLRLHPPTATRWGVQLRRWIGTRRPLETISRVASDSPVFLAVAAPPRTPRARWLAFLRSGRRSGMVTFKETPIDGGTIRSLIVPASAAATLVESLARELNVEPGDVRCFQLSPPGALARRTDRYGAAE